MKLTDPAQVKNHKKMNTNNIPESVRQKIDDMIEEANTGIHMRTQIKHMLTSICYEMYRAGYKDAHRFMIESLNQQKILFDGK